MTSLAGDDGAGESTAAGAYERAGAYEAAVAALADRGRFGIRLGLGRTRALLRELEIGRAHV